MNKVYRSIWNEASGAVVAAGEEAMSGGRRVSGSRRARRLGGIGLERFRALAGGLAPEERVVFDGSLPATMMEPVPGWALDDGGGLRPGQ